MLAFVKMRTNLIVLQLVTSTSCVKIAMVVFPYQSMEVSVNMVNLSLIKLSTQYMAVECFVVGYVHWLWTLTLSICNVMFCPKGCIVKIK